MSVEKANRTWHAGKPKKKPDYDREEITEELLAAVVGVYETLGVRPHEEEMIFF